MRQLHEWLTRCKGKKKLDFVREERPAEPGEETLQAEDEDMEPRPRRVWVCKLSLIKGSVGDRRLPTGVYEAEGARAAVIAWRGHDHI